MAPEPHSDFFADAEVNSQASDDPWRVRAGSKGYNRFFPLALFVVQAGMIVLWGLISEYDSDYFVAVPGTTDFLYYVLVAGMMPIGFGYLMTFLRRYGMASVTLTYFVTVLGVQLALMFDSIGDNIVFGTGPYVKLSILSLMNAMFCVAALLISFGALIGKVGPLQLTILTVFEVFFYTVNRSLCVHYGTFDAGGTITIHTFGAYFGLAASMALGKPKESKHAFADYNSDLSSMIGTIFLWLFWPAFNAGGIPNSDPGHFFAIMNTVISLTASTLATFFVSSFLNKGVIEVVSVQNATLAGGVAVGAIANFNLTPVVAFLVGFVGGTISTIGFLRWPQDKWWWPHDTCGIHNLHGMIGVYGGLLSLLIEPALPNAGPSSKIQAAAVFTTLGIAIATGTFTGGLLRAVDDHKVAFDQSEYVDENLHVAPTMSRRMSLKLETEKSVGRMVRAESRVLSPELRVNADEDREYSPSASQKVQFAGDPAASGSSLPTTA